MARLIDANGEYFETTSVVVSGPPFTMACWAILDSNAVRHTLMGVFTDSSDDQKHQLQFDGVASDVVIAQSRTTGNGNAVSTTSFSTGVWQHAAGVWRATNDRSAYCNGGGRGDNTTSRAPSGMNRTRLGAQGIVNTQPLRGTIAEAGIWDAALTDEEIAALARGVSPMRIRPRNLMAHWPVYDESSLIRDLCGTYPLTVNGSPTIADHAPVSPPLWGGHDWEGNFTAAGAPSFNAWPMMHHMQLAGGL